MPRGRRHDRDLHEPGRRGPRDRPGRPRRRARLARGRCAGPGRRRASPRPAWRRCRRPLILALASLLALAAIAGAATLGLPGLRLSLGPPAITPPPITPAPSGAAATPVGLPGFGLGLGRTVEPDDV